MFLSISQHGRGFLNTYLHVYSNAKSSTAAQFLRELVAKIPYKIKSIQVDGGSEFMKDFEKACEELGIPLVVLHNGGVERCNRICREEFYERLQGDSICGTRLALQHFTQKYNTYRPHAHLNVLTPSLYISIHNSGD